MPNLDLNRNLKLKLDWYHKLYWSSNTVLPIKLQRILLRKILPLNLKYYLEF